MDNSVKKIYFPNSFNSTSNSILKASFSNSVVKDFMYSKEFSFVNSSKEAQMNSMIEQVALWFLNQTTMSHKKLQKLCYYAYCWYITFYNDSEAITEKNTNEIQALCSERFQAWIHGPVSLQLYRRYKEYGWRNIPHNPIKPNVSEEIESLLQQVWDVYGKFSADELETISHSEKPWKEARKNVHSGEACANEISNYDILQYYSSLG